MLVKGGPGRDMILDDRRMPKPANNGEIPLDLWVDHIDICLINFAPNKQQQIREETGYDPVFQERYQVIHAGWPATIKELPVDLPDRGGRPIE